MIDLKRATPPASADRRVLRVAGYPLFDAAEIESRLEEHPEVLEATVLQRPYTRARGSDVALWAFVTIRADGVMPKNRTKMILTAWLAETLPRYKVPKEIRVIPKMPILASGKVDVKRLAIMRAVNNRPAPIPEVRSPWAHWRFEGIVLAWSAGKQTRSTIIAHQDYETRTIRRILVRIPERLARGLEQGEYVAVKGRLSAAGKFVVEELHRPRKTSRVPLKDAVKALEVI